MKIKSVSLHTLLTFLKYRISFAVCFTAAAGFLIYTGSFDFRLLSLMAGVFALSGGASALNQFQEYKYDALMPRTQQRPIPTGKIQPLQGLFISIFFIVLGALILYLAFGWLPAVLGLFNIVWYNLIYTNLKRITAFAVVPGSLVGAVPAFIGWTAAGGFIFDATIVFIAFFLFIWQVPHFWLLMLKYGDEYELAGYPTINQRVNPTHLPKVIFSWVMATSVTSLLFPFFLLKLSWVFFATVFLLNIFFIAIFAQFAFGKAPETNLKKSFISINVYMMLFMMLLIVLHFV